MPLSPEDQRLAQLLLARGLVPEGLLRECAREGDEIEAQGRLRPPLGTQLVGRRLIAPELYARFVAAGDVPGARASARFAPPEAPRGTARLGPRAPSALAVSPPLDATPASPRPDPDPAARRPPPLDLRGSSDLPQPGSLVGPYRLDKELGRGGMGAVYKARHERTGGLVAVKVLARRAGAQTAERFEREVQAFAKLRHPNVVAIHETGEAPSYLWYAMELVEGSSFDRLLLERTLPREKLVGLVLEVARGIEHAHARNVIHRDLKPSNVLVTADGVARVTDFGAARLLDRETRLTRDGTVVGTPFYMSPEQVTGTIGAVDERSDVWALGVMLYEVATGALPFVAETPLELCARICESDPDRPRARAPGLSPDLEAIILRALSKEKQLRYVSVGALADDLDRYIKGERVSASRVTFAREVLRRARKRPLWIAAPVALSVGVAAAALLLERRGDDPRPLAATGDRVLEAGREAGKALERIRGGKLPPGEVLALATGALGRLDEATKAPGASEGRRSTDAPLRGELVLARARALTALGELAPARTVLESAGDVPGAVAGDLALALGDTCLALGDGEAARAAFERAIKLAPERWEPLVGRVRARALAKDPAAAPLVEAELAKAREKQAPAALLLVARGEALAAEGKGAEALDKLTQAIKLEPPPIAARLARARLLRARDDEAAAVAELETAAEKDPQAARLAFAWHLELGALADAARELERLLALVPDDFGAAAELAQLRASQGDLDAAANGLAREAIPLAEARGKSAAAAKRSLARALAPIDLARAGPSEALAQRLESLGDPLSAALVRAETALDDLSRARVLDAALEKVREPEDRARLLAELATILARTDVARARERAAGAVELAPRDARALEARALVHARAGEVEPALADRTAADGARSTAYRRAIAEGRADALVLLEGAGRGVVERRIEEQRRSSLPRADLSVLAAPSRDLAARAERELAYAARLDPGAAEPLCLLARLAATQEALEQGRDLSGLDPHGPAGIFLRPGLTQLDQTQGALPRDFTLASRALDLDPLDAMAAELVLALTPDSVDKASLGRAAAAVRAHPSDAGLEMAHARRRWLANAGREDAERAAIARFRARPRDRLAGAFAAQLVKVNQKVPGDPVELELDRLDAIVDGARDSARHAPAVSREDFVKAQKELARALEAAPEDTEILRSTIDIYRNWIKASGRDLAGDWARRCVTLIARDMFIDGRDTGELVRWCDGVAAFLHPEDLAWLRARLESRAPDERVEAAATLALLETADPLQFDPRNVAISTHMVSLDPRVALGHVDVVLAAGPGVVLAHAMRGIHLARAGRLASGLRELERVLGRRAASYNDLWMAAATAVLGGDFDTGARFARRALDRGGPGELRDLLDAPPFLEASRRKEWGQLLGRGR